MATYKRLAIGESQIQALREAIEIRIIYLKSFEEQCNARGDKTTEREFFMRRSALVHVIDDLNENPWEKIP
jgi:hypothetical protein